MNDRRYFPKKSRGGFKNSHLAARPNSEEKCRGTLLQKLQQLKAFRVLNESLRVDDDSTAFEVLEFYGDSFLLERISSFIMQTRRFMNPHLMTVLRSSIVQNKNLAVVFDNLNLGQLLPPETSPLTLKRKADVVEAIIGELAEAAPKDDSNSSQISNCLQELLAYICYTGDQAYFEEMAKSQEDYSDGGRRGPRKKMLYNPYFDESNNRNGKRQSPGNGSYSRNGQSSSPVKVESPAVDERITPKQLLKRTSSSSPENEDSLDWRTPDSIVNGSHKSFSPPGVSSVSDKMSNLSLDPVLFKSPYSPNHDSPKSGSPSKPILYPSSGGGSYYAGKSSLNLGQLKQPIYQP
eukprot:TRINITY_DN14943_c0_g1_i1.p1 TRINITY_DN14943_c0_g1~~TRINITY_DN14943_c0_g1_i1.p1  ORF type:complete len:349 (-),score=53.55 TRINITY_DN14943_c0_g1_i1:207-1253(-)